MSLRQSVSLGPKRPRRMWARSAVFAAVCALALPAAAEGRPPGQQTDAPAAAVPRISVGELAALLQSGKVTLVDVRGGDSYRAGHIPGAISLPLELLAERWRELTAGRQVVAYCS